MVCSSREVSHAFFSSHPLAMDTSAQSGVAGPGKTPLHCRGCWLMIISCTAIYLGSPRVDSDTTGLLVTCWTWCLQCSSPQPTYVTHLRLAIFLRNPLNSWLQDTLLRSPCRKGLLHLAIWYRKERFAYQVLGLGLAFVLFPMYCCAWQWPGYRGGDPERNGSLTDSRAGWWEPRTAEAELCWAEL